MIIENSAKAIIVHESSILLIQNRDVAGLGAWYSLPGGRQKPEETLHNAIIREVYEETGCKIDVGRLVYVREYVHINHELKSYGKPSHKIELMFECTYLGQEELITADRTVDEEQAGVIWYPLKDLPTCNILPKRLQRLGSPELQMGDVYWGDILFEE